MRRWADRESLPKEDLLRAILRGALGAKAVRHEPLAQYTTLKVGGPADWFFRADNSRQLREAIEVGRRAELPIRVIGGASNVLVSDRGVEGFVILNRSKRFFVRPSRGGVRLVVDSGVSMPWLAGKLARGGVAGLEWLIGVPGTIGGGVVQNAGAWGGEIRDRLVSVEWLTHEGEVETVPAEDLDLSYRHSVILDRPLAERPVILQATFRLERDDPDEVRKRVRYYTMRRTTSQPRAASGGSTFKNPSDDYAGRLIEEVGLKGHRIGGAEFSPTHANFIVNTGDATAEDVDALIALAKERVREQFGVELELEIERIGRWQHNTEHDTEHDTDEHDTDRVAAGEVDSAAEAHMDEADTDEHNTDEAHTDRVGSGRVADAVDEEQESGVDTDEAHTDEHDTDRVAAGEVDSAAEAHMDEADTDEAHTDEADTDGEGGDGVDDAAEGGPSAEKNADGEDRGAV